MIAWLNLGVLILASLLFLCSYVRSASPASGALGAGQSQPLGVISH